MADPGGGGGGGGGQRGHAPPPPPPPFRRASIFFFDAEDAYCLQLDRLSRPSKCVKMHILTVEFSKFSGGACPRIPPLGSSIGLRPRAAALRLHSHSLVQLTPSASSCPPPPPFQNPGSATEQPPNLKSVLHFSRPKGHASKCPFKQVKINK